MTPSLATLDDAPSLKQKEWIQSEQERMFLTNIQVLKDV